MTNEQLVKENLNLIYKMASKFYGAEKEDLVQAGMLGLVKAYKKYNQNSEAKFSSYAYEYIYGEMYLVASKKTIKINKETLKMYRKLEKTRYEIAQKIGRIPTNNELSEYLSIPVETIDYACMSASAIICADDESKEERSLYETIATEEKVSTDDKILINQSLENLTIDEKNVIKQRYYKDKTQSEIARSLNMTQVMVSRLEKKGIEKMKRYISV